MKEKTGKRGERVKRYSPVIISPIAVALVLLAVFNATELFPFGERTVAWSDMNQQVVPLLCQFKDILDSKSGMLLSFKNASGMNFWGVFFFFLASPFTFLVKLVDKSDMLLFVNILVIMKSCTCAATASLYFSRSEHHEHLGIAAASQLGYLYALCGYVKHNYQNNIWLDMMYLFPLLLISLERLNRTKSPLMYSIVMALMIIVHYYIGYMVVIFVLLISGIYAFISLKTKDEHSGAVCRRFIIGSVIAAMLSAIVWLPCFLQYLTSGRRTSLLDSLRECDLVTDYDTVLPVIMCSSVLLLLAGAGAFSKYIKKTTAHKIWLYMSILLCIPLIIEPINKMWHTGSYMAFPSRYAFITTFALLILAAYALNEKSVYQGNLKKYFFSVCICIAALFLFTLCALRLVDEDIDSLSTYTQTLGGSEGSFKSLCRLLIIGLCVCALIYFLYLKGWIFKGFFLTIICAVAVIEAVCSIRIYMTTSAEENEATYALQREVFALADKIDDDSFYRVKTNAKIFDYNMIGAFGYNSIGHYTSLNDEDYMFTMKRLGYTSVWMEVGTCGGTALTDAILSIGYEIAQADEASDSTIYQYKDYYINELDNKLGLGILTSGLLEEEIPEDLTRAEVQQYVFESVFDSDEKIVSEYEPSEGEYDIKDSDFVVDDGERLIYRIDVTGKQELYFDCFDELTNNLSEPIYNSFSVTVNGQSICSSYPYSKENGVLDLGEFEDERVIIEVAALKDIECASFGVFSIDLDLLEESCDSAKTIDLNEVKNGLEGSITTADECEVLLMVPYDSGFTIEVNGEKTEYSKTLSGFITFELPQGECDISISFLPSGFVVGAVISVCGVISFTAYAAICHRRKNERVLVKINKASKIALVAMGTAVFLLIYIIPFLINIIFWKD